MQLKLGLGMSAGILAIGVATAAQAQDAPLTSNPAGAPAQASEADASALGDIVVTAGANLLKEGQRVRLSGTEAR